MEKGLRKKIITYTVISYSITWAIGFYIYYISMKKKLDIQQLNLYHALGSVGPAIGAFLTSFLFYGKNGVKKLFSKINFYILSKNTVVFIISPFLFFIIGLVVFTLSKSHLFNFKEYASINWISYSDFLIWLFPLISYSVFEEVGWRGFLLPHLQQKYNSWVSTIILSIIWALWHIPFFFYRFDFSIFIGIGFFFGIFVGSIILTSIYNSSKGNLIPVMLFHFFNNLFSAFDKEIIVSVLSTGFVFLAIFIYKKYGKDSLSPFKRVKINNIIE